MSRRRTWIVAGLIVVLLLAGIGDALVFRGLPLPSEMANTTWTLQSYSTNGENVPLPAGKTVSLTFQWIGHDFSGDDGCNSYFGAFSSLWPGRVSLSNLGQTVVGCTGPATVFEVQYVGELVMVDSYHTSAEDVVLPDVGLTLHGRNLILNGNDGRLELGFTASGA